MEEKDLEKEYNAYNTECTDSKNDSVTYNSAVTVFPYFAELKNEVEKMRTELSALFLERDELQYVICKNIEAKYMLTLGSIEYKAYETQCAALRLKRKIELIQAKKNRQEKVIISDIEKVLDREFAEYQKRLRNQIEKMNDALKRSRAKVLSDEENSELKQLYRKAVKALHPDMNPNLPEEYINLFENAVAAYKNGDLNSLRVISELIGNASPAQQSDALTKLTEEKRRLQSMIASMQESIKNIKTTYPYIMKPILENEEKLKKKKQELEDIIDKFNELITVYKKKLDEMLR